MSSVPITLLSIVIWVAVIAVWVRVFANLGKQRKTVSSDGHVIPKQDDITCEGKEGHQHKPLTAEQQKDYGKRYIVHNEPEMGYVVLNGVKRRISDCKDL